MFQNSWTSSFWTFLHKVLNEVDREKLSPFAGVSPSFTILAKPV